jgi:hypothetical protein
LDGSEYKKYTTPLTFTEEKEYTLKYFSVDNVGNDEDTKEITLVYDNTSPVTKRTITTDEHKEIISARSKIELSSKDEGIGLKKIVYKIDDGKEYTYKYSLRAALLSQGEHKLTYYAVDKVGNNEKEHEYNFYVDKTAPTIIEDIIAKTFFANGKEFASGKAQLKLTSFDNKAGVKEIKYSINNGEYKTYEKPVMLDASSGSLIIKTYAIDNVNNKSVSQSANEKTTIPYIDLSGPTLRHSIKGPVFRSRDTIFINNKTKIVLKGSDLEAGVGRIEYQINGGETKEYSEPFSIEEEGIHKINYIGYDNVENTSFSSLIVKVDKTGPEINYLFSTSSLGETTGISNYPKHVIIFLSGTDDVVGLENIKYGFGSGETKTFTLPISGFSSGKKTIKVIGIDKLGNSTEKSIEFDILK